jgi:antitoxin component YwqK of YwqJK toxin-antitoxin module
VITKKIKISIICFIAATNVVLAQRFADQVPQVKRYNQKELVDSVEGIKIFNKLIESIGGDSVKYNKSGYNLQGWNEDYYSNGKILHRGYYVDGKLVVFKNFFENGQCERSVVNPDPMRCNVEVFYEDGKQRKQVNYYNGLPQKKYEFYSNGFPKYVEENDKDMKYVTVKKSWYSNGQMENALELTDVKTKKYELKTYYQSGGVKEEGTLILSSDGKEYRKDGVWHFYDHDGKKKKSEKFTAHTKELELK